MKQKNLDHYEKFMDWVLDKGEFAEILDRCLEWLRDRDYLNEHGQKFAKEFWETYIQQ